MHSCSHSICFSSTCICIACRIAHNKLAYKTVKHIKDSKKPKFLKFKAQKNAQNSQTPNSIISEPGKPAPDELRPNSAATEMHQRDEDMMSVSRKTDIKGKKNKIKPVTNYFRPKSKLVNLTGGQKASVPSEGESYKL